MESHNKRFEEFPRSHFSGVQFPFELLVKRNFCNFWAIKFSSFLTLLSRRFGSLMLTKRKTSLLLSKAVTKFYITHESIFSEFPKDTFLSLLLTGTESALAGQSFTV